MLLKINPYEGYIFMSSIMEIVTLSQIINIGMFGCLMFDGQFSAQGRLDE